MINYNKQIKESTRRDTIQKVPVQLLFDKRIRDYYPGQVIIVQRLIAFEVLIKI